MTLALDRWVKEHKESSVRDIFGIIDEQSIQPQK